MRDTHKPVVVGTDGSGQALLAVHWAAGEARRRGTALRVIYAYPWLSQATGWETAPSEGAMAEARRVVDESLAEVDTIAPASGEVVVEDPTVALVQESTAAALVVVGARGRSGGVGARVGARARGVVENAHCDVVVVRAYVPPDGPVVVGMDPVDHSPTAMAYAFDDAQRRDVPVVVVQALERGRGDDPDAEAELTRWRERYPSVHAELRQVPGEPAQALLEASHGASVVVVGRTRRGFGGLRLGSVSRAIIPRVPVAAVPVDPTED